MLLAEIDAGGLRARAGITLRTVSEAVGVGFGTVWRWENRMCTPTGAKGEAYLRFVAGLARHEAVIVDDEPVTS